MCPKLLGFFLALLQNRFLVFQLFQLEAFFPHGGEKERCVEESVLATLWAWEGSGDASLQGAFTDTLSAAAVRARQQHRFGAGLAAASTTLALVI